MFSTWRGTDPPETDLLWVRRDLLRFGRMLEEKECWNAGAAMLLMIRDRRGRLRALLPNAAQRRYARRRTRRNILLKARQVGMTTYIAARYFLGTMLQPGTVTLQVAHSLESAQQIFRIVHRFAQHLDPAVAPALGSGRLSLREIEFPAMDSRYIVDTAGNANAGRGLTIHHLHASEVALWPGDPRETMAALLAAVAPGGQVDIESTPHGAGGYFHTEWERAKRGEGFTPHFFPWWVEEEYALPVAPGDVFYPQDEREEFLMDREGLRPEQILYRRYLRVTFGDLAAQEFAENDAECFLVSGSAVFDAAAVEACLREIEAPLGTGQNGAELVWLEPEPGREYIIGADVAEGVECGDFSAAEVIDRGTGLQCAELMARWPVGRFPQELAALGRRYHEALVAVERNNQGHAVLLALEQMHGYTRLYRHAAEDGTRQPGFPMNMQTKPQAIHTLGMMLRDAPGAFASQRLLEQCRGYSFRPGGETGAPPGAHDDLVMAMAIALAVRNRTAGRKI